ncbi:MAG: caspase family protein [Prosthecobacter sp.]
MTAHGQQTGARLSKPFLLPETGGHVGSICGLAEVNGFLLSAGRDKTMRMWDAGTGKLLGVNRFPAGPGSQGSFQAVSDVDEGMVGLIFSASRPNAEESPFLQSREAGFMVLDDKDGAIYQPNPQLGDFDEIVVSKQQGCIYLNPAGQLMPDEGRAIIRIDLGSGALKRMQGHPKLDGRVTAFHSLRLCAGGLFAASWDHVYSWDQRGGYVERRKLGFEVAHIARNDDNQLVVIGHGGEMRLLTPDLELVSSAQIDALDAVADAKIVGGELYVSGMTKKHAWGLWQCDSRSGKTKHTFPTHDPMSGFQSEKAGVLHAINDRTNKVVKWVFDTGWKAAHELSGTGQNIHSVHWSKDGQTLWVNTDGGKTPDYGFSFDRMEVVDHAAPDAPDFYTPPKHGRLSKRDDPTTIRVDDNNLWIAEAGIIQDMAWVKKGKVLLACTTGAVVANVADPTIVPTQILDCGGMSGEKVAVGKHCSAVCDVSGTIRVYKNEGFELLVSLFATQKKQWVCYSPVGYFTCGDDSEDFFGWQVARGAGIVDFFPASRLRSVYYRPDVIRELWKTGQIDLAVKSANTAMGRPGGVEDVADVIGKMAPPVVDVQADDARKSVKLGAGGHSVRLRYTVRTTGDLAADRVEIRFRGRPLIDKAPIPKPDEVAEVNIDLPEELDGDIAVVASHRYASSVPAFLHAEHSPRRSAGKGDLHVVAIGVSDLGMNDGVDSNRDGRCDAAEIRQHHPRAEVFLEDLQMADKDAKAVAAELSVATGRFANQHVSLLTDSQATLAGVTMAIQNVARRARAGDVVVVFLAGHGVMDPQHGYGFAVHDTMASGTHKTLLTGELLTRELRAIRASVVLVLDTCYSAAALGGPGPQKTIVSPHDLTGLLNTLSSAEEGVVVFAGTSSKELAYESQDHGLFTAAFLDALRLAPKSGGTLTCSAIHNHVVMRMQRMFREHKDLSGMPPQTPRFVLPEGVPDLALR